MPTADPDQERPSVRPSRTSEDRPRKKKGARRPRPSQPLDEAKLNAPDNQTLGMLGVLAVLTLVLWALAHAACNYHPPRETRRPRVVKTEEFQRDPKSAAIEVVQRMTLQNYSGALPLAAGSLAEEIKKEQASCAADPPACDRRKAEAANAQSMGVVLDRDLGGARVRVRTGGLPGGVKKQLIRVERDGALWKATARVPDEEGATLPSPVLPPPVNPHAAMPMPGAAAPVTTGAAPAGAPGAGAPPTDAPAGQRLLLRPRPAPAPAPAASQ